MTFRESEPIRGNAEKNLEHVQSRSLNLRDIALGYKNRVEELMKAPSAPAIRNEVQKYVESILSSAGPEQEKQLNELVKALEPYKKVVFADVADAPEEHAALALALVNREKELQ